MYEEYFSFSGNPFKINPDPRFFYGSASHNKAMSYLHYGLRQAEGFIVITGQIGAGKSMLIGHLLDQLDRSRVTAAHLLTPNLPPEDLLAHVLSAFHIEAANTGKAAELEAFEDYLFDQMSRGRRVLLIVDEAQCLPPETLEELRILSNIDYSGTPLFQIFLLAQPEFRETIARDDMDQLRQRIIASYHLEAMNGPETKNYIEHRLKVVGWRDNPKFAEGAIDVIFEETGGLPRKINKLCNRILLYCSVENVAVIGPDAVKAVIEDMREEGVDPTFTKAPYSITGDGEKESDGQHHDNKADKIGNDIEPLETLAVDRDQDTDYDKISNPDLGPAEIIDIEADATQEEDQEDAQPNEVLDAPSTHEESTEEAEAQSDDEKESDENLEQAGASIAEETQTASEEFLDDEGDIAASDADQPDAEEPNEQGEGNEDLIDESQMSVLDRLRAKREKSVETPQAIEAVNIPADDDVSAADSNAFDEADIDNLDSDDEENAPAAASIDEVAKAIEDAASRAKNDQAFDRASDEVIAKQAVKTQTPFDGERVSALYETPSMDHDPDGWRRSMMRSIRETQQDLKAAHHQVVGVHKEIAESTRLYKDKKQDILASLAEAEKLLDELRAVWR